MKQIDRRVFLKHLCLYGGGAALTPGIMPGHQLAFAEDRCSSNRRVVVTILLGGGPHAPSILVPRASSAYFSAHPTLKIENSLILDEHHGLHPNMTNLHSLFQQGKVALLNGAGYPDHSRSHLEARVFFGQASLEHSQGYGSSGWIGRYASTYCESNNLYSVISLTGRDFALEGTPTPPLAFTELDSYQYLRSAGASDLPNEAYLRSLVQSNRLHSGIDSRAAREVSAAWKAVDDSIATMRTAQENYRSPITYSSTSELCRRMREAAKLISSPVLNVKHIVLGQNGYDTHGDPLGDQATVLPANLRELDLALGSFWQDMVYQGRADDVVVQAYGEFGRTHENDSGGTDHGTGGIMILIGNRVRGGVASPAYTDSDFTRQDPWVPVKFDFREALSQVIERHLDVDATPIFPAPFMRIGLRLF